MKKKVGDTYINMGLKKSDLDAGLAQAKSSLNRFSRDANAAAGVIRVGFAAIMGGGMVVGLKKLSDAYAQQVRHEHMLAVAMKERGVYTDAALKHNLDYASSLQQLSTFGDEEIMLAQRLLTAYRIEGEMLDKLTAATLDLAAAKEMDLKGAADLVAKSVGSTTNALARYGIQIEGAVGSTARMQSAVDNISKLYSGSARAAAENYHGQLVQLKNVWGDLQESLGAFIGGPGGEYIGWLKDAIVITDKYVKAARGGRIEWLQAEAAQAERTLGEIRRIRQGGGARGWVWDILFGGDEGEAAAEERLRRIKAELDELEERRAHPSILELRRQKAGAKPAPAGATAGDDKYWERIFSQAAARGRRESELSYQMWLQDQEAQMAEEQRVLERSGDLFAQHAARKREDVLLDEETAYRSWIEGMTSRTETMSEAMKTAITGWGAHFSKQLSDAVWDADVSFSSIAESFGRMMTEMMIQRAVVQPIMGALFPSARGSVFSRGAVVPFARGGVVSRPTVFPLARGAGIMGEAGPEAVMPLARTSSGDLGVRAEGAGSEVNIYIESPPGWQGRAEESESASGGKDVRVMFDEITAGNIRPGSRTVRALRSMFGLKPVTMRR